MRAGLTPNAVQWCRCGGLRGPNLAECVAMYGGSSQISRESGGFLADTSSRRGGHARRRSPRTHRSGAIDRDSPRCCGCDSPVDTYGEVGFVRREKGSMHLQPRADVPAAANGGHDHPSLSWGRAPQAPNGYCRSVPPRVRGRARRLTSIRFRYAYGKVQAGKDIVVEQLVSVR